MSAPSHGGKSVRRRTQARRAWHALLTGLAAFAALQLAAAAALDLWFPGVIDADYGDRLARVRRGRAADPEHTLTVVCLGSSRVYYGLQADTLGGALSRQLGRPVSVVNFSFAGAGPMTELLTWRRLRRDGVRPDLVVVEAFPPALDDRLPANEMSEARMPADRFRWFDLPLLERYGLARPHLRRDVALADINPFYSRRLSIVHAVAPDLLPCSNAWDALLQRLSPPPYPADPAPEFVAARRESMWRYSAHGGAFTLGGRGCEALREVLRSCREARVSAALVVIPESPSYRSWYPPGLVQQTEAWVEQLSREEGAPLADAREWMGDDDFLDYTHLLPRPAERFTERFGREYLLPWLRGVALAGGRPAATP